MKQILTMALSGALMLSGVDLAWGKAHVPVQISGRPVGQVCAGGTTLVVNLSDMQTFVGTLGFCRLPACDAGAGNAFAPATGGDCSAVDMDANADGLCDLPSARIDAVTPLCVESGNGPIW